MSMSMSFLFHNEWNRIFVLIVCIAKSTAVAINIECSDIYAFSLWFDSMTIDGHQSANIS